MGRVLIVDDEPSICWAFRESLTDVGHSVEIAATAEEGLRIAGENPPDAVILDVRLPGIDGLTAMDAFRELVGPVPIVVMTAFGGLETAVKAIEGGAYEYLVKPFDLDTGTTVVRRALETRKERPGSRTGEVERGGEQLIGSSPAMQEVFKKVALVAPTGVPVLLTGESGTGKDGVARAIHRHGPRRNGPFLPVCVAALSPNLIERELFGHVRGAFTGADHDRKGLLELANGGTVLLDEIGDVPLALQVKLLRAIEQSEITPVGDARPRSVDIRFIAATNRPLAELMAAGQFREDLFFRLSVFPIHLPALRDRRDDIPALAEHFLSQTRLPDVAPSRFSKEVLTELISRSWKGNVRELRNAVEHAAIVARGRPIRTEHLPPPGGPGSAGPSASIAGEGLDDRLLSWASHEAADSMHETTPLYDRFLALVEPPLLKAALDACGQNRAATAEKLGIHRSTLRQKLRKYGMDGPA